MNTNSEFPPKNTETEERSEALLQDVETIDIPEKKIVPQINPETGVSADYINAINPLSGAAQILLEGDYNLEDESDYLDLKIFLEKVNGLISRGVEKYEEWFPEEDYENVVTDRNRDAINALNKMADEVRQMFPEKLTPENYKDHFLDFKKVREIAIEMKNVIENGTKQDYQIAA